MATKLYHRPNQLSINDSSLNSNKSENKNSSAFENLNSNNLSVFYKKDESQFKKKIDKLNLKFYLETDKFINLKSEIEKAQDHLHLLLFKQISEYIDEIERLNLKLKDKNEKEKHPKQILDKKDENSEKENNQFKKLIMNLEKQLKESKENELKLKKENESIKRQISHYKEQLNFEISERKKIKEKNCDFEKIETSDNLDNISKNENNFFTYNTQPISQDYNADSAEDNKLENIYDPADTPIPILNNNPNAKLKSNLLKAKNKKSDTPTNFNENNKKNHTANLNLIGKVKRSISYVSQAKSREQTAILQRIERKNKNISDELTTKTQISLYDTKINQNKIPKSNDKGKDKLKKQTYISKTVGKENNLSDKSKHAESNFSISQFKTELSSHPKKNIETIDNKFNITEFKEVAKILVGNMKDEIKMLKEEEEMLNQMRREVCEETNELVFEEDSYKSCQFDAVDNFLSNEISKVKTDDTQNYNSVNSNSMNKNKQKTYTNNLMNGIDNKMKNRKKGMKYLSSK